jgi:hypothetical protein
MAIERRKFQHITDVEDIPRKPGAVFDKDGHIRPSFIPKFALESLEADALGIEGRGSRKRLSPEEMGQIESLRRKADNLRPTVPQTGMDKRQFDEMRVHILYCQRCREESGKIRGDLPVNSLPFE